MAKETELGVPDNPDPHEKLRCKVIACAERQGGYDISDRVKKASPALLSRMVNKPLSMMRSLLEDWDL